MESQLWYSCNVRLVTLWWEQLLFGIRATTGGKTYPGSEHIALQNKPEDIELRNDSAQLSPLQKDNGDLEDDGVHFSHTQSCDGHESEVAQIHILNSSLTQSKVEGF